MANSFSQRARQRKVIYFALILTLLSVSVLHRKNIVEPMATRLKVREVARGQVDLTSSVVALTLTGSRGLVVTFLWYGATKYHERHEWNKLELFIAPITKLQPHFITPWLYQGWNLAYNVSVECDRPHDKYYYVSRGLHLLAEGERRNHEQSAEPGEAGVGQPDLRHFIGVAYQGKFGISDERVTMRSLLELSCIDPVRRDPERFWTIGADGRKTVDLARLADFCTRHPRIVRRLREQLGYTDPRQIVAFLADNREVPMRFEKPTGGPDQQETPLIRDTREQFPVLPPNTGEGGPNPALVDFGLTQESFDVFVLSRAWFEYAQLPVPKPRPYPMDEYTFEKHKHRVPRSPALAIFRSFPPRAQAYAAEVLTEEGWFDADGWLIRDWFAQEQFQGERYFRVGTEAKYHSGPAWERAFRAYRRLGTDTGQYMTEAELAAAEKTAVDYRTKYRLGENDQGPNELPAEDRLNKVIYNSWREHQRLMFRTHNLRLTNFEHHYHHAEAERMPDQVMARKLFFNAVQQRASGDVEQALALFDAAWPYWLGTCVRFPRFIEQTPNQEDGYELQLKHLRLMQRQYPALFKAVTTGMAQLALQPPMPLDDLLDSGDKSRIVPIRNIRGPLDAARVYSVKEREDVARGLLAWSQAAGTPRLFLFPGQEYWTIIALDAREQELRPGWKHMFDDGTIQAVKSRYGLAPKTEREPPPQPPAP
jgi:hypothetical protein